MLEYGALLAGIILAGVGGELFVRGTVGLGQWARISPAIVGATVAAFATSSPEFSVAINSALAKTPQIALGDSLGSNVVNVALILGIALLISGIRTPRSSIRRDFPFALVVPGITVALFADGALTRIDGIIMLAVFFIWLGLTVVEALKQREGTAAAVLSPKQRALIVVYNVAGLVLLASAGKLIVFGAKGIAVAFGVPEFVVGATIVAVGTSVPELATTIMAKVRGHDDIGLGTIIGSNIFNGACIVSVAAIIHPIKLSLSSVVIILTFGVVSLMASFPSRSGYIGRVRGGLLLVIYTTYLFFTVRSGGH
jgi:cation:H+ antiporter